MSHVSATAMRPLIGTRLNLVGHDVSLELAAVDVPDGASEAEMFSLVFEGPTDAVLWQAMWTLASADDEFELFLVPIGPMPSGRLGYEAVINRVGATILRPDSTT